MAKHPLAVLPLLAILLVPDTSAATTQDPTNAEPTEVITQPTDGPPAKEPTPALPPTTVHPAMPGDAELATQTLELFTNAGLTLSPVDIYFADNPEACEGNAGLHLKTGGRSRVDVCETYPALRRHAALHELAHAWATTLDEDTRDAFLALRGLTSWRDDDWQLAGTEHSAEIITWGLRTQPCWHPLRINDTDHHSLTAAFELLTNTAPRCDTTTPEPPPPRPDTILE